MVSTKAPDRIDRDVVYELYLMLELGDVCNIESKEISMYEKENRISFIMRCGEKHYGVVWRPSEKLGWITAFISRNKEIKSSKELLQILQRDYGLSDCEINILSEIASKGRFHDNPDITVVGVEDKNSGHEVKGAVRNSTVLIEAKTSITANTCIDVIDQVVSYALLSKPYSSKVILAIAEGFPCGTHLENRLTQIQRCTNLKDRIIVIENLRPDNNNAVTTYKDLIRKILCT